MSSRTNDGTYCTITVQLEILKLIETLKLGGGIFGIAVSGVNSKHRLISR